MLKRLRKAGIKCGVGTDLILHWYRYMPESLHPGAEEFLWRRDGARRRRWWRLRKSIRRFWIWMTAWELWQAGKAGGRSGRGWESRTKIWEDLAKGIGDSGRL